MTELTDKEKVLKWICEQSAAICRHPDVFACTWIASDLKIPVKRVRRWMKELEAEGFVKKSYEGGWDDWSDKLYCIHGYEITRKAMSTSYYTDQLKADIDWWNSRLPGGME